MFSVSLVKLRLKYEIDNQLGEHVFEVIIATITGIFVGLVFSLLKLPIPAPPVLSGIAGIFGIYLGSVGYHWIIERFFS